MSKIQEVAQAVENGKVKLIQGLVQEALDEGCDPNAILNEGMIGAMNIVGDKFQKNEIFVPEMLVAAKTMKKGVDVLRPHLAGDAVGANGKYIIGTVAGDLHDIGKNLVALMIESAGFEVIDLGVDVPAEKFVEAIKANPDCKVVGASALLTTTMDSLRNTVQTMIDAG
ncbi:MAG: B12-binding domain-containing protein, partial [Oscillospiraceae bacterium]|nr:B12-binding domain-containing protein [Oscillospiraceae bacterium]